MVKYVPSRRILFLCLFFFLVLIFWDARNATADSGDFVWCEARLLLLHIDPYHMGRAWDGIEKSFGGDGQHYYPPSGLLLLWPFAFFSWTVAKTLWLICNFCMIFLIFSLFRKLWLKDISFGKFIFFAMVVCASRHWRQVVGAGQQSFFALFFFLAGYKLALENRPIWAGILLQCSLFKYTLTLPAMIWMLFNGFPLAVCVAMLMQAMLFLFSSFWLAMSPWKLLLEYIHFLRHASTLGDTDISAVVAGFNYLRHPQVLVLSFLAVTLILMLWWLRSRSLDSLGVFSVFVVWSLLAVYHGDYDLCVLVFPLAILIQEGLASGWHTVLAIALVWLWYIQIIFLRFGLVKSDNLKTASNFFGLIVIFFCLIFMARNRDRAASGAQVISSEEEI